MSRSAIVVLYTAAALAAAGVVAHAQTQAASSPAVAPAAVVVAASHPSWVDDTLEPDGRARFVIAHRDPGMPNWLDTAGHCRGTVGVRWVGPNVVDVLPSTRVVGIGSLAFCTSVRERKIEYG